MTPCDFGDYFSLVADHEVMAMITERALEADEAKQWFADIIKGNQLHQDFGHFKITNAQTDEFIGYGKLNLDSQDSHQAELGYMLLPKFWGSG